MSSLAPAVHGVELLDDPDADPRVVEESLRHITRSNRWFGGRWAVRFGLARVLARVPRGSLVTLLDIGTGAGDLPLDAVRWGAARGLRLAPLGLERHRTAAAIARSAGLQTAIGCAGALPVRSKSVDVVIVSQLAHHLSRMAVVGLAAELDRIARVGVVVADLRRSALALAAFWCGSRLLRFDGATRADGITSIRRGYAARSWRHCSPGPASRPGSTALRGFGWWPPGFPARAHEDRRFHQNVRAGRTSVRRGQ